MEKKFSRFGLPVWRKVKSRYLELGIFLAILLLFNPYRGTLLSTPSYLTDTSHRNINVALGMLFHGVYPSFSIPFSKDFSNLIRFQPSKAKTVDLRTLVSDNQWPKTQNEPFWFRGMESGMPFAVGKLWSLTGKYDLNSIVNILIFFHMVSVLALFFMVRRLKIPGLAFVSAMALAFSPTTLNLVLTFTHYFFPTVCCSLGTFFLIHSLPLRRSGYSFRLRLFFSGGTGAIMGVCILFRSTVFLFIFGAVVIWIVSAFTSKKAKEVILMMVAFFVFFSITWSFNHNVWTNERLKYHQHKHHMFWHTLWEGLGEFENPYGFEWSDIAARSYALKKNSNIVYASEDYENTLKEHIFEILKKHPFWLLKTYSKKLFNCSKIWVRFLPGGRDLGPDMASLLFFLGLGGAAFWMIKLKDPLAFYILLPFLTYLAIPIVINSSLTIYTNPASLGVSLCLFYTVFQTARFVIWSEPFLKGSPKRIWGR